MARSRGHPGQKPAPQLLPDSEQADLGDDLSPDGVAATDAQHHQDYFDVDAAEDVELEELLLEGQGRSSAHDGQEPAGLGLEAEMLDAVVKIYATRAEPEFSLPWQRRRQTVSLMTGFVVRGSRGQQWVLTSAQAAKFHQQIKVKRRGDETKYLAKVLAAGPECDLALLSIAEPRFWEGSKPLRFGSLPHLQDAVAVAGFPIGGDTICVTSGVVSRIEVSGYSSGTHLLAVQIDAPINDGSQGGPALNDQGQCVGVTMQRAGGNGSSNIGYIIPTPIIRHFLEDYKRNGKYTGFPMIGIQYQKLESPVLRASLGLPESSRGVLVRRVEPTAEAASILRPDDVLMQFDGVPVANDGTVPFRAGERISLDYLTSRRNVGDTVRFDIFRDGRALRLSLRLSRPAPLVPAKLPEAGPSWLVVAGIVFTTLTEPYLAGEYGRTYRAPIRLRKLINYGVRMHPDEEVVILSQVLTSDATHGYEQLEDKRVMTFNRVQIRNLRHLVELTEACDAPFMRFHLEDDLNEVLVLNTTEARAATRALMEPHGMPAAMSPDLAEHLAALRKSQDDARTADANLMTSPLDDVAMEQGSESQTEDGSGEGGGVAPLTVGKILAEAGAGIFTGKEEMVQSMELSGSSLGVEAEYSSVSQQVVSQQLGFGSASVDLELEAEAVLRAAVDRGGKAPVEKQQAQGVDESPAVHNS